MTDIKLPQRYFVKVTVVIFFLRNDDVDVTVPFWLDLSEKEDSIIVIVIVVRQRLQKQQKQQLVYPD